MAYAVLCSGSSSRSVMFLSASPLSGILNVFLPGESR